jgi:hypothetical protein
MPKRRIAVVGGGAAGFFAAITCAEASPDVEVSILEQGTRFLSKVRISGGGRCNVTHACFEANDLSQHYPRGGRELRGAFQVFQPADTVGWFEARGVKLKTEEDGRMFPVTDSSQTIIDCLVQAARKAAVQLRTDCGVQRAARNPGGGFTLETSPGDTVSCDRMMLATGGCRALAAGAPAVSLGHSLELPVPSLFTFHISTPWLRELAGVSVERVQVAVPELKLCEKGALLITHQGVSGPVILRVSAWGARALHAANYQFALHINWVPDLDHTRLTAQFIALRRAHAARLVVNVPLSPVPGRLWERLVLASGVSRETRWANLSNSAQHRLAQQLARTELPVSGKTLNRDEFVTCGGVRLNEVNFKTMESRLCPGLFFGGELLDIDGLTGGFNFQAAWTTGWLAGRAMALSPPE